MEPGGEETEKRLQFHAQTQQPNRVTLKETAVWAAPVQDQP